jgi:hypothetical protein
MLSNKFVDELGIPQMDCVHHTLFNEVDTDRSLAIPRSGFARGAAIEEPRPCRLRPGNVVLRRISSAEFLNLSLDELSFTTREMSFWRIF